MKQGFEDENSERPLITFAVLAYNQEHFIRDAIEGAFSQTYSPLEIILSDDCSSDGTFQIIEKMAFNYRGPHRIIVNRNLTNLGLGEHINRVMELSSGALVVYAPGDDISLPERTSVILQAWDYSGRSVTSIYSAYSIIDKFGASWNSGDVRRQKNEPIFDIRRGGLPELLATWEGMVSGCTHAWSRYLFSHFGPLPANLKAEDFIFSFRSLAVAGILYIDRPLVKYRRHDDNLSFHAVDDAPDENSFDAYDAKRKKILDLTATSYDGIIWDIGTLRRMNNHDPQYLARLEQEACRTRELLVLEARMISDRFPGRLLALLRILSVGSFRRALKLAPQILPRLIYHKLCVLKRSVINCHYNSATG